MSRLSAIHEAEIARAVSTVARAVLAGLATNETVTSRRRELLQLAVTGAIMDGLAEVAKQMGCSDPDAVVALQLRSLAAFEMEMAGGAA